jgi:DNA mismatch endonuclease (patch repair protein)
MPKSNARFWKQKIERNKKSDIRNVRRLRRLGWSVMTIWECQLKMTTSVTRILSFLNRG